MSHNGWFKRATAGVLAAGLALSSASSGAAAVSPLKLPAASVAPAGASAVVGDMGGFNSWLTSLNTSLSLPAQDLAVISYHAGHLVGGAGGPVNVTWDAAARKIRLAPQAAGYASLPDVDLATLPQLRETLRSLDEGARRWIDGLKDVQRPETVIRALNDFFDRGGAESARMFAIPSVNPLKRTVAALSSALPAALHPQYDEGAPARQKTALQAWQRSAKKTYVLVNSYSFKDDGTPGLNYYDMRGLAQILWAADPNVNVVYVTAQPIAESMIQHVLQGRPDGEQIRRRVHFVALNDPSTDFLSQKLVDPKHGRALAQIRGFIDEIGAPAVFYPYMAGPYEWRIARELGLPDSLYGAPIPLAYWGTKSGGRRIFKAVLSRYKGTPKVALRMADGEEDIYDMAGVVRVVERLRARHPDIKRIAGRLNLGSSGEGNTFPDISDLRGMSPTELHQALDAKLRAVKIGIPDAADKTDTFVDVMESEGAAIEEFISGIGKATYPSVQSEILPDGKVRVLSSHEQILVDGNNYIGAHFQAKQVYRKVIEAAALEVAKELAKKGVVGRFGTDFAAVAREGGGHDVYLIENNIRVTGTTYPLVTAIGLTGAKTDRKGVLRRPVDNAPVRYKALDHDVRPNLIGLDVDAFLNYFNRPKNRVLFDAATGNGVLFHLLPAVKIAGNVGYTIIGASAAGVQRLQKKLTRLLDGLELEYKGGAKPEKLRFVPKDIRSQISEQIGHTREARLFREFLDKHPEILLTRSHTSGVLFHPTGYSVVGRNKMDVERLNRAAEQLLEQFYFEAVPPTPR
ncbi:MAG: hypothetical protein HYZ74_04200 [Elusimicrobia bacterium]|nr:hypothetical protein [Elusimicrobiota bacterium]